MTTSSPTWQPTNASRHCESWQFRCTNGQCIDRSWACDGAYNCADRSDESLCNSAGKVVGTILLVYCCDFFHFCARNPKTSKINSSGGKSIGTTWEPSSQKFFELRVLQKVFPKIFQHFEITLFTQLTSYNYSTLFALYTLSLLSICQYLYPHLPSQ